MIFVDVTTRPVGSFFGGRDFASTSIRCPVCRKPGLVVRSQRRGVNVTRSIAHAFELRLVGSESECVWEEPLCMDREVSE